MKFTAEAGHGGLKSTKPKVYATPGKRTPDGEPEWEFNNEVVKAYINELSTYEGVQIKRVDDPTGKTDVSLNSRLKAIHDFDSDCHLSFHHNANTGKWGDWTGVQTHVYESKPKEATALAKVVQPALVKAYGLRDRGIIYNDLFMTREPRMTSILLEGGFMDSRIDIKKMRDKAVLQTAGKEVAKAVAKYYGLKKKKEVAAKPSGVKEKEKAKTVYRVRKSAGDVKTQKGAFENLNSAKTLANKNAGYKVFDDKGKLIYTPPAPSVTYTVKSGDSLSKIASKYKTTVKKLQEANNIKNANKISIGQKIKIK